MTDKKITSCLLGVLVIIFCTMFVWTMNYLSDADTMKLNTTISAFNA